MKLAIIGYGKMGRMVEQLAPEYGFQSVAIIDIGDDFAKAAGADAAIEFTTPDAALGIIEKLAAMKLPLVVGTTGWLADMDRARAAVEKNGSALVWSTNFSVGVNVFLRVVRETARPPERRAGTRSPRPRNWDSKPARCRFSPPLRAPDSYAPAIP